MTRSPSLSPRTVLGFVVLGLVVSCDPAPAPVTKTWPPGTVLALDDHPISAEEIDVSADIIAQLEPDSVTAQARRIALTNVILPRAAGILVAGAKREEARRKATEARNALVNAAKPDFEPPVGMMQTREGVANDIGFEAWSYASTAVPGAWSEPLETIGAFEVVRVDTHSNSDTPRQVKYKLRVCVLAYIDDPNLRGVIETQLDRSKLTFVDAGWAEFVPELWKHRLRAGVQ
jgi:hypothetical protein